MFIVTCKNKVTIKQWFANLVNKRKLKIGEG